MNRRTALRVLLPLVLASPALGQTSIAPNHKHAWGENIGWTNWRDANGGSQGVRVHSSFLSGFIWGENVGWINLDHATHYVALLCGPDCEEDGDLDVFDFLCFQGKFAAQDPYADFEGDGDWDIFDFLAYQNAFALGCP